MLHNMSLNGHPGGGNIKKLNMHGNSGQVPYRGKDSITTKDFASSMGKKKLWEFQNYDDDATGLTLAESIVLDTNELGYRHLCTFKHWTVEGPIIKWITEVRGKRLYNNSSFDFFFGESTSFSADFPAAPLKFTELSSKPVA
ncbi:unnamed protein product [Phytophthora lilii]|uniref:Unnamed protein product n=1 Tax=Phytophthora lilii TaxID=2077276 RepID=A0A9W6TMF9_9STRA|nr:unnamed protein product [Phytophthora lilii]